MVRKFIPMKNKLFLILIFTLLTLVAPAQLDIAYQKPPREILDLIDVQLPPSVMLDKKGGQMLLLYREPFLSLESLAEPELKLAGLRLNPKTNSESRQRYVRKVSLLRVGEKNERLVTGLPSNPKLSEFSWSPDEKRVAFLHTAASGIELWILDLASATCKKLTGPQLNGNIGRPFSWFPDGINLMVQFIPETRRDLIDKSSALPAGPRVSVNEESVRAQNPTYQDLLKDKADEFNFEQLSGSTLFKVSLNGKKALWKETDLYSGFSFSPDGNYLLVTTIRKPFSYLVPYYRFPSVTAVYDKTGKLIKTLLESPLVEDLPKGNMAVEKGMRNINWRADKPATLYWAVALDEGDPAKKTEFRDEVFQSDAPFSGTPVSLLKTINRFGGITWGTSTMAIARDRWWNTRNTKSYSFNPSDNKIIPQVLFDRSYEDSYGNPGDFVTKQNEFGKNVLDTDGDFLYLTGPGYSPEGVRPFVDRLNLKTKKTERIWRADGKETLEQITFPVDIRKGIIMTSIESVQKYPNYYIRNIKGTNPPEQVTFRENPYQKMQNVYKELINYKRNDGVELSATLYLPPGYDRLKKEKLPMIMWAYPREFKDKSSAGQVTTSPFAFTSPSPSSPVWWVMRGYAILDNAAFPIVGEGKNEPNDTFVDQLVANARAAIDAVDAMGYIDRNRIAVGGHSYGAFMTANLLSHSDLFAAGIARSGAYNRTLTPFGFQNEERTYWDAPEVYNRMSPFMNAPLMKTPLLLIHGEADNNSGTFPLQSERYFNALKGLGAPVRLVFLPLESHGYAARESILHMLWEQDQWFEKWVKNKKPGIRK